jgi:hypothetical protein
MAGLANPAQDGGRIDVPAAFNFEDAQHAFYPRCCWRRSSWVNIRGWN